MKPWKRLIVPASGSTVIELQWGHGDEAVEEQTTFPAAFENVRLQWGHGDEAVEEGEER